MVMINAYAHITDASVLACIDRGDRTATDIVHRHLRQEDDHEGTMRHVHHVLLRLWKAGVIWFDVQSRRWHRCVP